MFSFLKFLQAFVTCLLAFSSTSQNWEQFTNFPGTARDDGASFTIGDKYYCGTGRDTGFDCKGDFYIFDGINSTWSNGTSLPLGEERQYATSCSWENKGFVFGGAKCDGTFLNDLWVFDPISSIWTEGTTLPGSGRGGSVHFILEDTLYIVGGRNDSGILSEVWGYDFTSGNWTQKTDYPNAGVWRGTAFSWQNTGYAGLGKNDFNGQTEFNTAFYAYDPVLQNWSITPDFGLSPKFYIGSAQKDSLVFFFGGVDPGNVYLNTLERLDVSNWSLFSLPNFISDPRKGSMCFLNNDYFYTTTGVSETERLNETWRVGGVLSLNHIFPSKLVIYPNPSSEIIRIDFDQIENGNLIISSVDGKFIQNHSLDNIQYLNLDVSNFSNGLYFLRYDTLTSVFQVLK